MKAMSRWLRMFNVSTDSNAKQRVVAKQWHGDSLKWRRHHLLFLLKIVATNTRYVLFLAYIQDFPSHALNLLDMLDENGLLLFERDRENINLKIGGDHGENLFKMSFQIVNMKNPNSKENTMVFAMFEAKDYRSNLEITLNKYKQQIDDLQLMKWKNQTLKFLCLETASFRVLYMA